MPGCVASTGVSQPVLTARGAISRPQGRIHQMGGVRRRPDWSRRVGGFPGAHSFSPPLAMEPRATENVAAQRKFVPQVPVSAGTNGERVVSSSASPGGAPIATRQRKLSPNCPAGGDGGGVLPFSRTCSTASEAGPLRRHSTGGMAQRQRCRAATEPSATPRVANAQQTRAADVHTSPSSLNSPLVPEDTRLVLTSKLASRLMADLLETFQGTACVEEARADVCSRWGFTSAIEMEDCIQAAANASYLCSSRRTVVA
eukprot:TRINITY_DN35638_c0_g1_i1.p1 TRINITY_DN35638_c0_g1~~TRINITY_DN35638_c0_g1_i1.p1  ORF type:complete len:257 (+),score=20.44 TRINITY_DN35638_c0_g1_i1:145-915(+)